LTEQQPKQKGILNTKIDYNNTTMVHSLLFIANFEQQNPPFWRQQTLKP